MKPTGLVVCMPTRGAVSVETMLCLRSHMDGIPYELLTAIRKPVHIARNELAKAARATDATYVLWVDDDAWWRRGCVRKAIDILEQDRTVDMLLAPYSSRAANRLPVAFTANSIKPLEVAEYPAGSLIPLAGCGFHWLMMRRDLLERVGDEPFSNPEAGDTTHEDFIFCDQVRRAGGKIAAARDIIAGHVEVATGRMYFPGLPAMLANGLNDPIAEPPLMHDPKKNNPEGLLGSFLTEPDRYRVYGLPGEGSAEVAWQYDVPSARKPRVVASSVAKYLRALAPAARLIASELEIKAAPPDVFRQRGI